MASVLKTFIKWGAICFIAFMLISVIGGAIMMHDMLNILFPDGLLK